MKIPPPWSVEAHQLQCSFASSRNMFPTIIFPLSQSETKKSSQPTRSLAAFLAPRNLLVSWPSMLVTPRKTKHKCSKKTIIRNISSKDFTTSHHAQTSTSSPYLSSFHTPFPKSPQPRSLLSINLPYLDFWENIKIKLKYK
jgi:hypothetical protein